MFAARVRLVDRDRYLGLMVRSRRPGQVVAEHAHAAGGRLGQAEQQPDQGCLAGAVGAKEAEGAAARDLQPNLTHHWCGSGAVGALCLSKSLVSKARSKVLTIASR